MKSVTAIIVAKNNPPHLFESIASVNGLVSEIIIGNIEIGKEFERRLQENRKIRIVNLPSTVAYADLVKEELKKNAKGEFILYLDPDEIFPSISDQKLTLLLEKFDCLFFPRKNIIFGKWIRHSRWWPDYQPRLFRKNSVVWPKLIHPVPQIKGKEFRLEPNEENAIFHYNYDHLDQFLEKSVRYAKAEAKLKKDYSLAAALGDSTTEFISRYFAAEGYKDGMHGFTLAVLQMFYYFLVYFYSWEYKKYSSSEKDAARYFGKYINRLNFEINFWLVKKNLVSRLSKAKLRIQNKVMRIFSL